MRRAREKTEVIEFIQFTEKNIREVYTEVYGNPDLISETQWHEWKTVIRRDGMNIKTHEGTKIANIGDYILFSESKALGRHCWPVKPDYFENAYDEIAN